eukprot:10172987-Lingulodinium_polyedra.AAC.1
MSLTGTHPWVTSTTWVASSEPTGVALVLAKGSSTFKGRSKSGGHWPTNASKAWATHCLLASAFTS